MTDALENIRIGTFNKFSENKDLYHKYINKDFKVIHHEFNNEFIAILCLKFFEFILYANYVTSNNLMTKCDIDRKLLRNRSDSATTARKLLSELYRIRNKYAHSNYDTDVYVDSLKNTLSTIKTITEFKSVIRLLIPSDYPINIINFYFIVDRKDENPEYDNLCNKIISAFTNMNIKVDDRIISKVFDSLVKDYNTPKSIKR